MIGVGAFQPFKKTTVKAFINPYDKSTLVSIYPKVIKETKITLMPGLYELPPGSYEKPSLLVIGSASWWREVNEDEPLLEITQPSPVVAESIVRDFLVSLLASDGHSVAPGFFWVPGEVDEKELKTKYKNLLDKARDNQHRYYQALVKMADSLWARTNGNPLAIHEDAKLAARELGLTRDWTQQHIGYAPEIVKCVACGSMRNPNFPICPTCKAVIDVDLAKKLNLKFAE